MSTKTFIPLSNEAARECESKNSSNLFTTTAFVGAAIISCAAKAEEVVKQLPTVTVIESSSNQKYNTSESSLFQFSEPLLTTPQTVSVVSQQLMKDQGVTTLRDSLRNVPGLSISAGEGGAQGDNLTIRGFSARNDFFVDGMRDFGSYYRDPFNVESVEVVQGPSSIIFGRGSTGGAIQQSSKQAFLGYSNKGSVSVADNDTRRVTADVNTKIKGIEGAAFRINAMDNFNRVAGRDVTEYRRYGVAPTVAFGLGTDNRLILSYFHQAENDIPDYGLPWFAAKPAKVDRDNFYGFSSDYLKTSANITTAKYEHDFNENTSFRNQLRYAYYTRSARITEPQISAAPTAPLSSISATRRQIAIDSAESFIGDQADLKTKFETLTIKHDLVSGFGFSSESSSPTRLNYSGVPSTSLLSPQTGDSFSGTASISSATRGKIDSVYAYTLDTLHLHEKLDLVVSARFDNIKSSYDQTVPTRVSSNRTDNVWSWHEGLVYKPANDGSIYIDYGTSFNPSAESFALGTTAGASSANIAPEKNEIYELGTKWDFLKKRLSTAFAIFRGEKTNARETDPNNTLSYILSGKQRVNGFQAQASGEITKDWKVNTSYAYLDAEITKTVVASQKGNGLANTPRHTFNLFTTYKVTPKLEIGGGVNYLSSRYASSTIDTTTGTQKRVGGYATFNAMAKYPLVKGIDLQLNITNLTNKYYMDQVLGGHVVPSEGRVVMLTTNFSF